MIEDIINILRINVNNDFSYAKYYRNHGDLLSKLEKSPTEKEKLPFRIKLSELEKTKPKIPEKIRNRIKNELEDVKEDFIYLFLQPDSYFLLWLFNEIEINDKSILSAISSVINKLSSVTRGGINIYKRNGWMIHVLYGYQLINYNIPRGYLPDTISWQNNLNVTFVKLMEFYNNLSPDYKIVLNICYFLHDIGVIDGVQDHSKNGPKYVPIILKDLNINREQLKRYGICIDYLDLEEILKILIENHTLINLVSGEYSDEAIIEKMILIKYSLSKNTTLCNFYHNELSIMLFIIGVADFIAVDDCLFNLEEFKKILQSYEFIQAIIGEIKLERPVTSIALSRVRVMVKQQYFNCIDSSINNNAIAFNLNRDTFMEIIYNIRRIEYCIAILKPMNDPGISIKILFILCKIIKYKFGVDKAKSTKIIFDSSLDIALFKKIVEKITPECLDKQIENKQDTLTFGELIIRSNNNLNDNIIVIRIL
jgi:hypothetical protein